MIIDAIPPAPPAIVYTANNCEKGSRECFPDDLVGVLATTPQAPISLVGLSLLVSAPHG